MTDKFVKCIGAFVASATLLVVTALIYGWIVQVLVNYVFAPSAIMVVFGVSKLTFWKAYLLALLSGLLFKSNKGE